MRNRGAERVPQWHASYFVVDGTRRHQVSKGPFESKADAEAWLRDELDLARAGKTVRPTAIIVARSSMTG